jgi:6-methylsalicylate decarboxylase
MSTGRIDVHQHVVPPFWAEALAAYGGDPSGWSSPAWTPENAIDFMDSHGIAMGILSLTRAGRYRLVWGRAAQPREAGQ